MIYLEKCIEGFSHHQALTYSQHVVAAGAESGGQSVTREEEVRR